MNLKKLAKDSVYATLFILASLFGLSKIEINSDILNPLSKALGDFELTDIVFSHMRENSKKDDRIIMVNIGDLDRYQMSRLIDSINQHQPKVIALDIMYRKDKDPLFDSCLAAAFSRVNNLVLSCEMIENPEKNFVADSVTYPIPNFRRHADQIGFVDVIAKGKDQFNAIRHCTVKENILKKYKTVYSGRGFRYDTVLAITPNGDTVKQAMKVEFDVWDKYYKDTMLTSFPTKIAWLYDSNKVKTLLKRDKEFEIINYRGNLDVRTEDVSSNAKIVYPAIDYSYIIGMGCAPDWPDSAGFIRCYVPEIFKDKIVILGYMGKSLGDNNWEDKFFTPLNYTYVGKTNPDMYGVVVHANIVSMILDEDYINEMPDWLNLLISLVLIYLNVFIFSWMFLRLEIWYDGVSLVVTLIQVLILTLVVLYVFSGYEYTFDITLATVALFLMGNLIEIYYGLIKPLLLRLEGYYPNLRPKALRKPKE